MLARTCVTRLGASTSFGLPSLKIDTSGLEQATSRLQETTSQLRGYIGRSDSFMAESRKFQDAIKNEAQAAKDFRDISFNYFNDISRQIQALHSRLDSLDPNGTVEERSVMMASQQASLEAKRCILNQLGALSERLTALEAATRSTSSLADTARGLESTLSSVSADVKKLAASSSSDEVLRNAKESVRVARDGFDAISRSIGNVTSRLSAVESSLRSQGDLQKQHQQTQSQQLSAVEATLKAQRPVPATTQPRGPQPQSNGPESTIFKPVQQSQSASTQSSSASAAATSSSSTSTTSQSSQPTGSVASRRPTSENMETIIAAGAAQLAAEGTMSMKQQPQATSGATKDVRETSSTRTAQIDDSLPPRALFAELLRAPSTKTLEKPSGSTSSSASSSVSSQRDTSAPPRASATPQLSQQTQQRSQSAPPSGGTASSTSSSSSSSSASSRGATSTKREVVLMSPFGPIVRRVVCDDDSVCSPHSGKRTESGSRSMTLQEMMEDLVKAMVAGENSTTPNDGARAREAEARQKRETEAREMREAEARQKREAEARERREAEAQAERLREERLRELRAREAREEALREREARAKAVQEREMRAKAVADEEAREMKMMQLFFDHPRRLHREARRCRAHADREGPIERTVRGEEHEERFMRAMAMRDAFVREMMGLEPEVKASPKTASNAGAAAANASAATKAATDEDEEPVFFGRRGCDLFGGDVPPLRRMELRDAMRHARRHRRSPSLFEL